MPTGTLPKSAKATWEKIYNSALQGSCKGDKGCAAATAWSAIKQQGWHKANGKWTKKADFLAEASMYITKSSMDGKVMRWSAVNSDTDPDTYTERMSFELFSDFIGHIKNKEDVPEIFRSGVYSKFWKGGMPYVSISHYPDLNGQAVPGEPTKIFVDGDVKKAKLKANGVLYDSPLGHSVYRALQEDKNKSPEDRIRISIGFLDLAHKHGENGKLWVRNSLTDLCPECLDGVGWKIYVKGYLIHLALTRVPVNKRTEIGLEEKSMATKKKITRKEDAASIIGASLAEEIDAKNKVSTFRSDALVEMSESETPEETQELIAEAEANTEVAQPTVSEIADNEDRTEDEENSQEELVLESMTEADMKKNCTKEDGTVDEECMKKMKAKEATMKSESEEEDVLEMKSDNSGYIVSDRGDGQPALPTKKNGKVDHRLMGAAWAALHGGYRGNKYEGKGKAEAIKKLTAMYKREGLETPKSESEKSEGEVEKDMGMNMTMPYNGATSMKDAQKADDMQKEMVHVMDLWSMFSNVAWNIMDSIDVTDKKGAFVKALDEFKGMLAAKAMVEFSTAAPVVEKSEANDHELKPALDALLSAVDNSLAIEGDVNNKLQFVNPSLQELGQAITDYVTTKSVANEPPAPNKDNDNLLEKITELIQPISKSVQELSSKVGVLEAKSAAQSVEVKPRIPQPRSLPSSAVQKATVENKPKPGSLRSIINKSVGLE